VTILLRSSPNAKVNGTSCGDTVVRWLRHPDQNPGGTGGRPMPELPEVESARAVIDGAALRRAIVDVDDSDTYECRPHRPGEIRAALVSRQLTAVHRRGKSLWCDSSGTGGSGPAGPALGLHLGMSGKIVVADGRGQEIEGGDYWQRGRAIGDYRFSRFSLTFADGGSLLLVDPRRLGRVRLDPPVDGLGPDASEISPAQFRAAFARGTAPVKARLLDQHGIAGIGNLLADQVLWEAKIHPGRPVGELSRADVDRLAKAVRHSVKSAIAAGGVHGLPVIAFRTAGAACPRCGAPMAHGKVGGRTTWWCPREQV
jgi:formamidopyrimidine-DNA glycosylase